MQGQIESEAGPSSPRSSTTNSVDLPSLQPLSHEHPLLSAPTFSADAFLLSRLHIPLEELRGELRTYLGLLREELVQLINDDYEEFISLGTGLRGENERLRRLQHPLKDLAGEVGSVRDVLLRHQDEVQEKLDERSSLREERSLLDMLQRLFETLTRAEKLLEDGHEDERSKMVQRVAGEYTQLVYLLGKAKAEGCQVVDTLAPRVGRIRSRLSRELSQLLLDALEDASKLKQVLKTYEVIEGWAEAEETITASALVQPPTPVAPITPATPHALNPFDKLPESTPLAALYNKILGEVSSYGPLLETSEELSDRFGFLATVLWPEIATRISSELGNTIFAAGRPDDLHKHYTSTHDFISHLESLAPSAHAVLSMRSSPAYETFEKRWQLPVYFQLRWKEIVTTFESALGAPATSSSSGEWALPQSAAAWKAFATCWDPDLYIPELSNRFWRLALQISIRYATWLKSQLKDGGEDAAIEEQTLKVAAAAVLDLQLFERKARDVEAIKANGLQDHLTIPVAPFSDKITAILTDRCTEALKLVRSVASQLRASPSKSTTITPSYFVPSILKPLHGFYAARPTLKTSHGGEWSPQIVDAVCTSYAGILAGVRKTEDLLRRHRKSKKTGFSLFGGGSAAPEEGDEDERFKKQMEADVGALKADAEKLGVDVEGLSGWKELVQVINRPPE